MKPVRLAAALAALLASTTAAAAVGIQFGHFAPTADNREATALTVRVNGQNVVENFRYGDFTAGHTQIGGAGTYLIEVLRPGSSTPAASTSVVLADNRNYGVYVIGNEAGQPLALLTIEDPDVTTPPGSARLRVLHAAPLSSNTAETVVDVRTDSGTVIDGVDNIAFRTASSYLFMPPDSFDWKLTTADGSRNLADFAPLTLTAGTSTTLVIAGDGVRQPLTAIAIPGGALATEAGVDLGANGAWMTGNASGQGLSLFPVPGENRLVGAWYTWTPQGQQTWYTLDSCQSPAGSEVCSQPGSFDNRSATLTVYAATGGSFLSPNPVSLRAAGTLTVQFTSCTSGTATYNVDGATGQFAIANLVPTPGCTISAE